MTEEVFWPVTAFDKHGHMAIGTVAETDDEWSVTKDCGEVITFCGWKEKEEHESS